MIELVAILVIVLIVIGALHLWDKYIPVRPTDQRIKIIVAAIVAALTLIWLFAIFINAATSGHIYWR